MSVLLGIDLGTSSVKAMIAHSDGRIVGIEKMEYEVLIPQNGYAEQTADSWWRALLMVLRKLRNKYAEDYRQIECVGYSGQMHGLVMLDNQNREIRPSIIWLDQRSARQTDKIQRTLGIEFVRRVLHNRIYSGFSLPSLLWVRENEPENFGRIRKIVFPKDYVRLQMTGIVGSDHSDASASLMYDMEKCKWSVKLADHLGIPPEIFPQLGHSTEIAGYITKECAALTGLRQGLPVVYGSGDQMAQSVGNGVICPEIVTSNIGTGGQISACVPDNIYDPNLRLNSFCHAVDNATTVCGATLCAGMSLSWAKRIFGIEDYDQVFALAQQIPPGSEGLIYLPYLTGERTPHMDPHAKGMFFGLSLGMDVRHFIQAVLEGVVYSLKDSLTLMENLGIHCDKVIASGGGAQSKVWLQMQADILGKNIHVNQVQEQACLGACMLAGIGVGVFASSRESSNKMVKLKEEVFRPNPDNIRVYKQAYEVYRELYQQNKELMWRI